MAGCDCSASSQKRKASKEGIVTLTFDGELAEFELVLQRYPRTSSRGLTQRYKYVREEPGNVASQSILVTRSESNLVGIKGA